MRVKPLFFEGRYSGFSVERIIKKQIGGQKWQEKKARVGTVKAVSILAFAINQDLIHPQRCFHNPEADGIPRPHRHPFRRHGRA